MKKISLFFSLLTISLFPCLNLLADTVVLDQGQILTGNILAEKNDQIVLDIGIDVLVIFKDEIIQYEYTNSFDYSPSEPNKIQEPNQVIVSAESLYSIADLPMTTIEQCIQNFSEAVVKVSTPSGMGSGFFINSNGWLITNFHVIEKETKIEVTVFQQSDEGFQKKTFKKVKIDAINPFIDLALLKVEDLQGQTVKCVYLGDIDDVEVGQGVFAVGNPLGLERTVTNGVISTKNRAFQGLVYIQTNADINPGNSGGPLFNLAGEVIGVTNMGYIFFGGLGFAIPIDYVKRFIDNREAFAYDKDNPNTGFRYIQPNERRIFNNPEFLKK